MIWQIFKQPETSIGLEISHTGIQCVCLTLQSSQSYNHKLIQTPISNSQHSKKKSTIHALKQLTNQFNTNSKKVATTISSNAGFSLLLSIDIKAHDIQTAILLAAAPLLPLPLDTLYFDFQIIKKSKNTQQVLIVFCKKESIEEKMQLVQSTGLHLTAIEPHTHALERSYRYLYDLKKYPNCWVSILLNQDTYTLLLWSQDKVIADTSDTIDLSSSLEAIVTQIYQKLMCLLGIHTLHTPQAVHIVGNHSFSEVIQNELQTAFKISPLSSNFYLHSDTEYSEKSWHAFYIALGLALRKQ